MATYATLAEVKSVLRTWQNLLQGNARVDFSEAYSNLHPDKDNPSLLTTSTPIRLKRVSFDDSWSGIANFTLTFTSSTEFDATMQSDDNEVDIDIGSGDVNTDFDATNPVDTNVVFTIESAFWTGTAMTGDKILFRSQATMSNDDAEAFIGDAETIVDAIALAHPSKKVGWSASLVFAAAVPNAVNLATKLVAAYLIVLFVIQATAAKIEETAFAQFFTLAKNTIRDYVEGLRERGPSITTHQPLWPISPFDKLGTPSMFDLYKRQGLDVTLDDVSSRLRTFKRDQKYVDYVSETSGFA